MFTTKWLAAIGFGLTICGSIAWAGSGHSGGGNGIVLPTGQVRFMDSLSDSEIPSKFMSRKQVMKKFFEPNRYVKKLGTKDTHFFDCAKTKLSPYITKVPAIAALIPTLESLNVVRVEFPLYSIEGADQIDETDIPFPLFASTSKRVDVKNQWAMASYQKDDLWVARRLYEALPSSDQCAVQIHEAFRHLNRLDIMRNPLTTEEIEGLTAEVIQRQEHPSILAMMTADRNVEWKEKTARLQKEIDQIADKTITYSQVLKITSDVEGYWGALNTSPSETQTTESKLLDLNPESNDIGMLLQHLGSALNQYTRTNILKLDFTQMSEISNHAQNVLISSKTCFERATIATGESTKLSKYLRFDYPIVAEGVFEDMMIKKLPPTQYFDVVKMKLVTRLDK